MAVSHPFDTEDNSSPGSFRESANPFSLFSDPPSRFPENLPSQGYDECFDPPLGNDLECGICHLGLREPVQTPCGHRFCRGCMLRSIREVGAKCPDDNEHLEEWQIIPDSPARHEVLNYPVFCHLKKLHGCRWKGPLSKLEDHLKECDFADVLCPKNCGKELQRKDLNKHLKDDCPNRTMPCSSSAEELLWNSEQNHLQGFPQCALSCKKCGKENIPRNEMQDHIEKGCPLMALEFHFSFVSTSLEKGRPHPTVNEDLPQQFGALRIEQQGFQGLQSRSRRTRGEVEVQERTSQDVHLSDLATSCQQQQTEIDGLRGLVKEVTGAVERCRIEPPTDIDRLRGLVERLKHRLNESQASQDVHFSNMARLCQQQQAEIGGLRGFVYEMTGALERLERRLNKSLMRVETRF